MKRRTSLARYAGFEDARGAAMDFQRHRLACCISASSAGGFDMRQPSTTGAPRRRQAGATREAARRHQRQQPDRWRAGGADSRRPAAISARRALILLPQQQIGLDRQIGLQRPALEAGQIRIGRALARQQHRHQPLGRRPTDAGEIVAG
jgi:hypothetical protein